MFACVLYYTSKQADMRTYMYTYVNETKCKSCLRRKFTTFKCQWTVCTHVHVMHVDASIVEEASVRH